MPIKWTELSCFVYKGVLDMVEQRAGTIFKTHHVHYSTTKPDYALKDALIDEGVFSRI